MYDVAVWVWDAIPNKKKKRTTTKKYTTDGRKARLRLDVYVLFASSSGIFPCLPSKPERSPIVVLLIVSGGIGWLEDRRVCLIRYSTNKQEQTIKKTNIQATKKRERKIYSLLHI